MQILLKYCVFVLCALNLKDLYTNARSGEKGRSSLPLIMAFTQVTTYCQNLQILVLKKIQFLSCVVNESLVVLLTSSVYFNIGHLHSEVIYFTTHTLLFCSQIVLK